MQNKPFGYGRSKALFFLIPLLLLGLARCTKKFPTVNTDPTKLSNISATDYPYMFSDALMSASYSYSIFETAVGTYGMVYAQFFEQAALSFPTDRYVIRQDWLPSYWNNVYVQAVPQLRTIIENTDPASAENALANIWWVWTFHRVTDYTGPIPYFQAGSGNSTVPFNPQDSVYYDFFKRLDAAVTALKNHTGEKPFSTFDLLYRNKTGSVNYWIKFANTLRLRLALRVSKVDPVLAQQQAEAAVAGGVMMANDDDAYMPKTAAITTEYSGLATMGGYNEIRMSATMESILKGYNDPRMPIYFQPTTSTHTFEGVRNGLEQAEKSIAINSKAYNSQMGTRWVTGSDVTAWVGNYATPQETIMAAEAYFLRAEGALNGWNMGDNAQHLYETGIQMSMEQWGITDPTVVQTYISNPSTPIAPQDGQSSPPVNNYPVQWSSDLTMQRKQVAQQKWLALFPDGMEGWAEVRRSGYPEIYPVVHNDNPDIPAGGRIRRIPFISTEVQTNGAAVTAAIQMLGGPDNAATPLWWDKN